MLCELYNGIEGASIQILSSYGYGGLDRAAPENAPRHLLLRKCRQGLAYGAVPDTISRMMNPKAPSLTAAIVLTGLSAEVTNEIRHLVHHGDGQSIEVSYEQPLQATLPPQSEPGAPPHTHDREPYHPQNNALVETHVGTTASDTGVMPVNAGLSFPWAVRIR